MSDSRMRQLHRKNDGQFANKGALALREIAASSADGHLALVLNEIVALMGGMGAILFAHVGDGAPPQPLYLSRTLHERTIHLDLMDACQSIPDEFEDGECFWHSGAGPVNTSILILPLSRANGHNRLTIAVVFDRLDDKLRNHAEALYRERRPLAIGYFHLWQANRGLRSRVRSLETALNQMAIGVLLLDQKANILFANTTSEEIMVAGDGLRRTRHGPRAVDLTDALNLQAALNYAIDSSHEAHAPGGEKTPLLTFRRKTSPPLVAAVSPSGSPPIQPDDIAAIMYVIDPLIDTETMLSPLCRLYNLSSVETRLACLLAGGHPVGEVASIMRIKEQTARGYLKSIFIKTSTRRQTELVALLLSSLIRMNNYAAQEAMPAATSEAALSRYI